MKKKTQKIRILKNHYRIKNDNNKSKDSIYEENDNSTYSYSYLSGNNLTMVNNASSAYLLNKEKEPKKANIILQKIKMENDDINKNKNFNITLQRNYSYLNYDDNDFSNDFENEKNVSVDGNECKMILRQKKRKKIFLKSNDESEDNKSAKKVNSDKKVKIKKKKNKKINKIKINFDFDKKSDNMKDTISKKINKINKINKEEDSKKTKENSNDNDEVFFYNGCDNYIIKEKYENNILTSNPKVIINQNPINSCSPRNTVSINFQKPKIEINNNFNSKSINVIQYFPNDNCKSTNNILSKNKNTKSQKSLGNIYKKKQTNNSLTLSRNFKQSNKEDSNTNTNANSKSSLNIINNNNNASNFNCFNSTKINTFKYENYNIPLLTEANKAYFKINTNSKTNTTKTITNSKSIDEIVSKISNKYKVYRKPSKPEKKMTCFQQTFKEINDNKKIENIINPDSVSFGSPRNDKENNDNKEQKVNDNMNEKNDGNIEVKKDISNNKKSSLISKDTKEEDNGIFSNSIDEPNHFGPRISIHKKQKPHHSFYYPIEKSNDENYNNNAVSFKDNISPIESIESCRISTDEKILNKKFQTNSVNYSFDKIFENYVHLPKSELLYFTKEKKIIIKNNNKIKKINKNENKSNKSLKNKIAHKKIKIRKEKDKVNSISKDKINNNNNNSNSNNNYIPIKNNEENKDVKKNTFEEMVDRLNEKFGKRENKMAQKPENKKSVKESYSYDPKKKTSNSNKLNENNSASKDKDKDEIDKEKKQRYKIRSVVKIIKKNKSFGYLSLNKISKEEESEIKEEIKKEQTKQEQTKYNKITIIIKEDIENFISFYNKKNGEINGGKNANSNLKYDWSIIEQLIIKAKVDIVDIINGFLLIFNEIMDNKTSLKIFNEYISQIIEHYKNNYLNEKNIKNIRIKILKILKQIDSINISNKYKFDIFGNLFYHFLIEGLFTEEDLNYFENEEQKIVIEIAKMIKNILILFCENNNNKACNEYHTKFKKTKLFNKNPIYFNYVTKYIKSSPNISSS